MDAVGDGAGLWFAEFVATFGLLLTIIGCASVSPIRRWALHHRGILSTASSSFANPAVTIAGGLSDTFAGIVPTNVAAFICFQFLGAQLY